jgi:hypothetical protein
VCGLLGHSSNGCPEKGLGFFYNCDYCKIKGHKESECPMKFPKGGANAVEEEKGLEPEGSSQEGKGAGYVGYQGFEMGGGFEDVGQCFSVGYEKEDENKWTVKRYKKNRNRDNINQVNAVEKEKEYEWEKLKVVTDSGTVDNLTSPDKMNWLELKETELSRRGMKYSAATGGGIRNIGERRAIGETIEGEGIGMTFQVGKECKRTLGSVKRMCGAGNRVVFDDEGSYIEHKASGKKTTMYESEGTYAFDIYMKKPKGAKYTGTYAVLGEEGNEEETGRLESEGFVRLDSLHL